MAGFLEGYEDVQARVKRFQIAFPVGRIETDIIWHNFDKGQVLAVARIYREHEDTLPASSDWAFGDITTYPQNLRKFYVEDTVTSAIGRSLNSVLEAIAPKATSQDMQRVEYVNNKPFKDKLADKITVEVADDPWTVKTVAPADQVAMSVDEVAKAIGATVLNDDPTCKHGNRIWATGTSKAGKVWGHWKCDARPMTGERWADVDKCDPLWCDLTPAGTWKIREDK